MWPHSWRCSNGQRHDRSAEGDVSGTRLTMARNLLMMFGAFVLASALAGALGAVNLGTALAFGQIGFAAMTVYVLIKR
jgi:hypothetical protein